MWFPKAQQICVGLEKNKCAPWSRLSQNYAPVMGTYNKI